MGYTTGCNGLPIYPVPRSMRYLLMIKIMEDFRLLYPEADRFIADLPCPIETFLSDYKSNVKYPFWAEFEYFLSNTERLGNTQEIVRKISSVAPMNMDSNRAWGNWRDFRSAQFEITAIFLIEKYFGGEITQLVPHSKVPTPDFEVRLNQGNFMIEAKAQSGQQHGNKHPRQNGTILIDTKDEIDLLSWLFEETISSRNKKAMEPQAMAAEKKGADILICQTDYRATKADLLSQVSVLCPQNKLKEKITLQSANRKAIIITFFQATYPGARQITKLKEIWLCHLYRDDYEIVVLSKKDAILMNHLTRQ